MKNKSFSYNDHGVCTHCGEHTWDKGLNNTIDTRYQNGRFDMTTRRFFACGCIEVQSIYADGSRSETEVLLRPARVVR